MSALGKRCEMRTRQNGRMLASSAQREAELYVARRAYRRCRPVKGRGARKSGEGSAQRCQRARRGKKIVAQAGKC